MVGQSTMRMYCLLENTGDTYCSPNPQRFLVQDILRSATQAFWSGVTSRSPMLEVLSAVTGESIAVFEDEEIADRSVKALKQRLAQKIGLPRFRLRLLQDNCPLDNDQIFVTQVVQLVIVEFQPPDTEQSIMVACRQNDDKLLEQQLNIPRSPNFQDANHKTPLYVAASNGSLKCVLLLLEAGANKDQGRTDNGSTPLCVAAHRGHLEVVRFLVESGANKDQGTTDKGETPLCIAAHRGHLEVVRILVESGANKDQGRTDNGATPLFSAAHSGHLEVVRFLVKSGASKDQGMTDTTPLYIAAQNGHLEVVRFLVESGVNKDQGATDTGDTPLFIATQQGHLKVVQFLVESGANKDQGRTDNGATPLCIATQCGHLEVVRCLVESGANKDQGTTDKGVTPLCIAAHRGHLEVVRILVESGANKDQGRTDNGATPLFSAAHSGHLEVVRFLVKSGASKDQGKTDNGATPVFIAAQNGHLEVVKFLVESGAKYDQCKEHWIKSCFRCCRSGAPWSCPISGWVRCQQRPSPITTVRLQAGWREKRGGELLDKYCSFFLTFDTTWNEMELLKVNVQRNEMKEMHEMNGMKWTKLKWNDVFRHFKSFYLVAPFYSRVIWSL